MTLECQAWQNTEKFESSNSHRVLSPAMKEVRQKDKTENRQTQPFCDHMFPKGMLPREVGWAVSVCGDWGEQPWDDVPVQILKTQWEQWAESRSLTRFGSIASTWENNLFSMSTGDRCLCSMLFLLYGNQGSREQTQPLKKSSGFYTHQDCQSEWHTFRDSRGQGQRSALS